VSVGVNTVSPPRPNMPRWREVAEST